MLVDKLQRQYPTLQIVGSFSPPFRSLTADEEMQFIEAINQAEVDILWVALGSPVQELWMAANRSRLNAPVIVGVGAAFDFIAGIKKQAPRWIQRSGFEWIYRLVQEPRRLWPRYRQYPKFILYLLFQSLGLKTFPFEPD
jgi:N-acetylglucosaminyldiphosphoundecaprenol N-acetyl-beta-D-mannosaminyltransferase